MPSSDRPTAEEIQRLVAKLRPEIVRRFVAQGVSEEEAAVRVKAALRELAYRWNEVGDRERWLLLALSGEAPNGLDPLPRLLDLFQQLPPLHLELLLRDQPVVEQALELAQAVGAGGGERMARRRR